MKNNLKHYFSGWQDKGLARCFPLVIEILFPFLPFLSFFSTDILKMGANTEYREVAWAIVNIAVLIYSKQAGTLVLHFNVTSD